MTWAVKTIHRGDLANPVAESLALTWRLRKTLNEAGEAIVILNDDSAAAWQKYDPTGANSYVGGRLQIEYPAATTVFDGCITRIEQSEGEGIVTLTAENWLQQLKREQVTFDTRADLDGSGLREAPVAADFADAKSPVYTSVGHYFMADRNVTWAADQWNPGSPKYYAVFSHKMAAVQSVITPPYDETVTPSAAPMTTDSPANGEEETWETEGSDGHEMADGPGEDWTVDYQFNVWNTLTSAYYASGSYTGSRVHIVYQLYDNDTPIAATCTVWLYDETAEAWREIGSLPCTTTSDKHRAVIEIPKEYSNPSILMDAGNAYCTIRFDVDANGAANPGTTFHVFYLAFEIDVTMSTADNGAYEVLDTFPHKVEVDTDLSPTNSKGIWEGCPYSIAPVITYHLADLIGDADTDVTLDYATNVTASTDVMARNFLQMYRLEILQELARADGTDFWLGADLKLTWNSTYAVAGCTNWTDASVLQWITPNLAVRDIHNKVNIKGLATNYSQVSETSTDAGSVGNYGTYSLFVSNPGIYTDYEAELVAAALKDRYKNPPLHLAAEVNGFPKTEVGAVIEVDSTKLELVDAYYVITDLEFDQGRGTTIYHLAPRANYLHPERLFADTLRAITRDVNRLDQNVAYTARPREVYT